MSDHVRLDETIAAAYPRRNRIPLSDTALGLIACTLDTVAITAASVLASIAYNVIADGASAHLDAYFGLGIVAAILFTFVANSSGLYRFSSLIGFAQSWSGVVLSWLLVVLLLVLILFLLKIGAEFSRGTMLLYGVLGPIVLVSSRAIMARYLRAALHAGAAVGRRAVVIGDRVQLAALTRMELAQQFAITEIGRIALPGAAENDASAAADERAALDHAIDVARLGMADEVVLAIAWADLRRLDLLRQALRVLPLPVRLLPDRTVAAILKQPIATIGGALSIEIQRSPLSVAERFQKRLFDIVLGSAALVALAPFLVLIAIAVKLNSDGPAIFRQRRKGFNGGEFLIFKFRSMNVLEDGSAVTQATKDDPRVTRIGRILRQASFDELPQLINVIRGEMSLVGPRPHAVAHDDAYSAVIAEYAFRHHVKPGITGWAQINGWRGETRQIAQMRQRVEHDLWYIDNWSIWLDVMVLLRTAVAVLRGGMAY